MTQRFAGILAAFGAAAILAGAFAFQHLGGLAPCALCIWQRYPHAVAIGIGVLFALMPRPALAWLGVIAALSTAGIGGYHVGVEQGWWAGPATCSGGGSIGSLSADELFDQIMAAPVVRCNEVAWSFAGLSMAAWNAVLSLGFAGLWVFASGTFSGRQKQAGL